jgi:hypothetical protein
MITPRDYETLMYYTLGMVSGIVITLIILYGASP